MLDALKIPDGELPDQRDRDRWPQIRARLSRAYAHRGRVGLDIRRPRRGGHAGSGVYEAPGHP
jgi:hypothetical protein